MKKRNTAMIVSLSLLLTACASSYKDPKFSVEEVNKLNLVEIAPTVIDNPEKANIGIDPTDDQSVLRDMADGPAPTSLQGVAVGLIIGGVIDGVSHVQQTSNMKKEDGEYLETVLANFPDNLAQAVNVQLSEAINENAFFAPRVRDNAGNVFSSEITHFGFKRISREDSITYYSFLTNVDVELEAADGSTLVETRLNGISDPRPLREYAETPALIQTAIEEALFDIKQQMAGSLNAKTNGLEIPAQSGTATTTTVLETTPENTLNADTTPTVTIDGL